MGQIFRLPIAEPDFLRNRHSQCQLTSFSDLHELPPELGTLVLSNLNATDLCLASCVWNDLASTELLWHG